MIKARRAMSNSNPRLQKLIQTALGKREHLLTDETDLVRLIDGDGDGLPGIILENFGPGWLISTQEGRLDRRIMDELSRLAPSLYWKRLDQHLKEAPQHLSGPELREFFTGKENGLISRLSFQSGYSQGIFIDQRDNRAHLREMVKPGQTVLNTFSYTGFFSVAAAAAGATTTTLDLSQVYLDWAKAHLGAQLKTTADLTTSFSIRRPSPAMTKERSFELRKTTEGFSRWHSTASSPAGPFWRAQISAEYARTSSKPNWKNPARNRSGWSLRRCPTTSPKVPTPNRVGQQPSTLHNRFAEGSR